MLKNCFLFCSLLFCSVFSFGQNIQKMENWQDSLLTLGQKMFSNVSEVERIESNFLFVKTLVSALKEPNSYYFNFEKLKFISSMKSPDENFRIFSWNIPMHDGSYLYYGSVQFKSGSLKLIPLLDKTFEIPDVNKTIVDNTKWYGAQYYEIVPFKPNQYLLLGWKGHDAIISQKVIEILNFDEKGNISFGSPIFSDDKSIVRKVFTYARQATMFLQYNRAANRIEFDNLVVLDGQRKEQKVPDLTHDAYQFKNNILELQNDIAVMNLEN